MAGRGKCRRARQSAGPFRSKIRDQAARRLLRATAASPPMPAIISQAVAGSGTTGGGSGVEVMRARSIAEFCSVFVREEARDDRSVDRARRTLRGRRCIRHSRRRKERDFVEYCRSTVTLSRHGWLPPAAHVCGRVERFVVKETEHSRKREGLALVAVYDLALDVDPEIDRCQRRRVVPDCAVVMREFTEDEGQVGRRGNVERSDTVELKT